MATIAQTRFECVDAGTYRARVDGVELTEGEFGPQLKFKFGLAEEGFEDVTLLAWASAKLSPKSKLYGWVNALIFAGAGVPADFDLDTGELVGKECQLLVEVTKKDTGEYNKVKDVLPIRRAGSGRRPSPSAAAVAPAPVQAASKRVRVGDDAALPEPPGWGDDEELPF